MGGTSSKGIDPVEIFNDQINKVLSDGVKPATDPRQMMLGHDAIVGKAETFDAGSREILGSSRANDATTSDQHRCVAQTQLFAGVDEPGLLRRQ